MHKILLIIVTSLLVQRATANPGVCRYFFDAYNQNRYTCELSNAVVPPGHSLTIIGDHLPGQMDVHVQALRTINCSIPEITNLIMVRFENLLELDLTGSGARIINANAMGSCRQVERLTLARNSITTLPTRLFESCGRLREVNVENCDIVELPIDVFGNALNLTDINFDGNQIWRLNSLSFGNLPQLLNLRIRNNEVDEIQRGFFNNFPALSFFHGEGNRCVDRQISRADIDGHLQLELCYRNFDTPRPPTTPSTTTTDGGFRSVGFGTATMILMAAIVKGLV